MTTATRRPRPDFAPLLFLLWAALVLGTYLRHHPLPLHDGVPVKMGMLTAAAMLAILLPLWWPAKIGRGPQVEHLLVLPVLMVAGVAMLPADLLASVSSGVGIGCCLLWLGGVYTARKYHWQPHRYLRRALMAVLALGILLSLAAVQRNLHPVGYLTGCVDREQWRQQYGVQP